MAPDPALGTQTDTGVVELTGAVDSFWRVLLEPAIPILVLGGCVHVARHNADDVVYFFGTALLILLDRVWARSGNRELGIGAVRLPSTPTFVAGCAVYAVALAQVPRAGWPSMLGLAVPGVLAAAVVLRTRESPLSVPAAQQHDPGRWLVWPVLGVAICLWEAVSFLQQPDTQTASFSHPTMSSVIDPLIADPLPRAVLLLGWLLVGWWVVRAVVAGPRPGTERCAP